jgi:hypothetical protein
VATLFGLVPMSAPLLATLLAIVVGYVVATEIAKLIFYRTLRARHHRHGEDRALTG